MQQIIDHLFNYLAAGKHLMFFYLIASCSIGLPTLAALVLVNLKNQSRTSTYMIYFLAAKTGELIFLCFIMYQHANIPFGFRLYENVLIYSLQSLAILFLPGLVNELFAIAHRRQINCFFSVFLGIGLILIIAPYLFGIYGRENIPSHLQEGIAIESLISFKIYRLLFWSAYLYAFLTGIRKFKAVDNIEERNFRIRLMALLLVLVLQLLVPVIKTFPENVFSFATGYFFLNILLLKNVGRKFFEEIKLIPCDSLPEVPANTMILTAREREVLSLLEQGLTNKNIGDRLYISETTVKTHLKNIYHKFGVNNRMRLLHRLRNSISSHITE